MSLEEEKRSLTAENHMFGVEMKNFFDNLQERRGIDKTILSHGWIIAYLNYETIEKELDVYQKDIEKKFHMPRSTATTILKKFEREDLIKRVSVETDARLKKIELTEKGVDFFHNTIVDFEKTEKQAKMGITEEEFDSFMETLRKMRNNFEKEEC
ncbi:MAG: MarR family transcriptional regulator [Lachnospiraceae bacterium]|nr:MarR family transcriptional regulator [Lachnospiraceae bacterium]